MICCCSNKQYKQDLERMSLLAYLYELGTARSAGQECLTRAVVEATQA